MSLESASLINQLVVTNPEITDKKAQGPAHIRTIKTTLKNTFPNIADEMISPQGALNKFSIGGTASGNLTIKGSVHAGEASPRFLPEDTAVSSSAKISMDLYDSSIKVGYGGTTYNYRSNEFMMSWPDNTKAYTGTGTFTATVSFASYQGARYLENSPSFRLTPSVWYVDGNIELSLSAFVGPGSVQAIGTLTDIAGSRDVFVSKLPLSSVEMYKTNPGSIIKREKIGIGGLIDVTATGSLKIKLICTIAETATNAIVVKSGAVNSGSRIRIEEQ